MSIVSKLLGLIGQLDSLNGTISSIPALVANVLTISSASSVIGGTIANSHINTHIVFLGTRVISLMTNKLLICEEVSENPCGDLIIVGGNEVTTIRNGHKSELAIPDFVVLPVSTDLVGSIHFNVVNPPVFVPESDW